MNAFTPKKCFKLDLDLIQNPYFLSTDCPEFSVEATGEDCARCKLHGKYILVLERDKLQLMSPPSRAVLMEWNYRHIRNYEFSVSSFSLFSGTRSPSGVGMFTFLTKEGSRISSKIQENTRRVIEQDKAMSSLL